MSTSTATPATEATTGAELAEALESAALSYQLARALLASLPEEEDGPFSGLELWTLEAAASRLHDALGRFHFLLYQTSPGLGSDDEGVCDEAERQVRSMYLAARAAGQEGTSPRIVRDQIRDLIADAGLPQPEDVHKIALRVRRVA